MGQNFISCDRGQVFLLPPSLTDWLAEDHLVWTVLGAVDQMDLDGFYGAYRANGQGRAAYDPRMMVALLLYAYCVGVRSSRQVERACRGDVAFKVITAMEVPDHSTIAEFRRRHRMRSASLLVEVLALCAEAGLVAVGEIAVDGTKMRASASYDRNRGYASIVEEILDQAEQIDRQEDERYGDARGDELPEQLRTREGRRAALEAARERMQAEREAPQAAGEEVVASVELGLDPARFVTRPEGRRAWLREGRRALEGQRDRDGRERSPAGARSGSWRSSAALMRSSRSPMPPTAATSSVGRRAGCATAGGSAPRPIPMSRHWCRGEDQHHRPELGRLPIGERWIDI